MDKAGKRIEELRSKDAKDADFQVGKKKKKKKSTSPLWIMLLLCVAALAGVVGYAYKLLDGRIPKGTVVAGVDLGGMEQQEAVRMLKDLTEAQTLSVSDEDGDPLFTLPLITLIGEQDYAANLETATRNGSFFAVSEETVASAVHAALFPEDYIAEEPQDSVLSANENGLYFTKPTHGNLYDADACTAAVCAFLAENHSFGKFWQLTAENAYTRIGQEPTAEALAQAERVEEYVTGNISIAFLSDICYTLSQSDILAMLNEDCLTPGAEVKVVPERVSTQMDAICKKLDVDGTMAKYGRCAETREYLYLKPDDTGFTLDRATLDAQVCEALEKHEGQLTTSYDYVWWLKQKYGWHGDVNDCLEVSLDNQYIWFYRNGQLLTEAPIVSGNLATYNITRTGIFQIYGMVEDTVLKGPTWNDHVDYWMPFDGDIGIHDSDWRDEYGGDIYKENGSHGCVNTPIDAMRIVYENSFYGMLVIVR